MNNYASNREQIVSTAAKLVHVKGFNNTSVQDILEAGGIGKGRFFYYFKSKEELGYAVLEAQSRSTAEKIWDPALKADIEPLERIFRLLDRIAKVHRERGCIGGCPVGSLAVEMSDIHDGFRKKTEEIFKSWSARIKDTLREGVKAGQLKKSINIGDTADFVVASMQGVILLSTTAKDPVMMRRCFRNLKSYLESLRA